MMPEVHLFTAIMERQHKKVELNFYEDWDGGIYELSVIGLTNSEVIFYFDKDGKYLRCLGLTN